LGAKAGTKHLPQIGSGKQYKLYSQHLPEWDGLDNNANQQLAADQWLPILDKECWRD
jgi:hypothetical protein